MPQDDPNLPPETDPIPPVVIPPEQPPAPTAEEILKTENEELKKKFGASTTENQVLQARLTVEENARKELTKEPTDSDYRTAFPTWDVMSDTEKDLARRTFGAERIGRSAAQLAQELQAERSLATSIELAIASNNALQGKEQAFRQYASKPQYKNVPMDVLVDAFLQKNPSPTPTPTPKPGLEPGSSGPRITEKPKTLTGDELLALRTSDYKTYVEYLRTHDINVEV
jgi:hypothetical protein